MLLLKTCFPEGALAGSALKPDIGGARAPVGLAEGKGGRARVHRISRGARTPDRLGGLGLSYVTAEHRRSQNGVWDTMGPKSLVFEV
ncbi:unnamed protein product [Arctogadus glacialis]